MMTKNFILFFKKAFLCFGGIILALTVCSCGGDKNAQRIKDATLQLDNSRHTLTDEYDYWPECGLRITGSHLASLLSLEEFEKMFPCPLYVSGPHHDGQWDLENTEVFGYYNPKAIQYLADLFKKVVADKNFVEISKPLVDKYLYDKMHIMMGLHDVMYSDNLPDLVYMDATPQQAREAVFDDLIINRGECFGPACDVTMNISFEDPSWTYNGSNHQFLYFWARRWKDGTIDLFYQALRTFFLAYYPEYENDPGYTWLDEDYLYEWEEGDYEGDGFAPTQYDYELEEDEPVSDEERLNKDEAVKDLRAAIENLDNTYNVMLDEFDYWPECGLRITASHLFSLISLKALHRMLPCDLYLSGPHHYNHWEMDCSYDFGKYNPEAVQYLGELAKKVVSDKSFVKKTQPLVDKYLKRQMFILKSLYEGLNDPELCQDKRALFDDLMERRGNIYGGDPVCMARDFIAALEPSIEDGSYVYSNTGEMFLYFWARRDYDETIDLFYDILNTVYSAYYPQ